MSEVYKLLVINPGSTSTKLALFENEKIVAEKKIAHSAEEIAKYPRIIDQIGFRRAAIDEFLKEKNVKPSELAAVVGRGGIIKPIPSGTYAVCPEMLDDVKTCKYGEHASNIGCVLANSFTKDFGIPAFIVDPTTVDELQPLARYSGLKEIPRFPIWHALNAMAVTRQVCKKENLDITKENFVVAHIGGGITVSAMAKGKCVDVSNGIQEGPFTPERAGVLPTDSLVKLCYSGKTIDEVRKMLVGRGGLVSYLGTSSLIEVEERINKGCQKSKEALSAMAYQIAKTIGSYVAVHKGNVKYIIFTGGGAHCKMLTDDVAEYVKCFAPIYMMPGEDELSALAMGGLRVLRKEAKALDYAAQ